MDNLNSIVKCPALAGQIQTANQHSKGNWMKFAMLACVGLAAALLTGCDGDYTGGGSIDSAAGAPEKATFGFNIKVIDNGDGSFNVTNGQFQYNDHGAGIKFHVDRIVAPGFFTPDPITGRIWIDFSGTYTSDAGDGEVIIGVCANNDVVNAPPPGGAGFGFDDSLLVMVGTGPYAGYVHNGEVNGGNIQWHQAKSK